MTLKSIEKRSPERWLVLAAVLVAVVPIWVATVRALGDGWLAIGDNANFLIRSRDVFTRHHPLLGTWTSASLTIGENVDNPGPLLFDVFAVPAKLAGSGGLAVAVALLNTASVAGIGAVLHRVGGARLALAGLAASSAVAWAMGSELLFDPWQPHSLLLPFLCLLALVWAMVRGLTIALPVAAFVASLIVQTHLSYAVVVPVLCLWGVVWLWRQHGRDLARPALVTLGVLAACWVQPLWDQLFGEGNLGTLAGNASGAEESVGASLGLRLVADVVATPPFWARPSFADAVLPPRGQPPLLDGAPNLGGLPSTTTSAVGLGAVALLLAAAWFVARRRGDRDARAGVGVAVLALLLAVAATVTLPIGALGVSPHQVRFLWPVAAFVTAVVVLVLVGRTAVLAVAVVVLSLLAIPRHNVHAGPADDEGAIPIVRSLASQLDALEDEGTLLYDTSGLRFAEPWTSSVMAALQDRGIEFRVDDEGWVGQMGPARRHDGDADARVFVREGDAAQQVPDGATRVAHVEGLTREERDELAELERGLANLTIRLNGAGRAARDAGALPSFAGGAPTVEQLLGSGELSVLVRERLLRLPQSRRRAAERYADLRYRWDRHTVAVFLDDDL